MIIKYNKTNNTKPDIEPHKLFVADLDEAMNVGVGAWKRGLMTQEWWTLEGLIRQGCYCCDWGLSRLHKDNLTRNKCRDKFSI